MSTVTSPKSPDRRRWPRRIYDAGEEPDYRFSLANERTLLAWLRTCLALVAVGVAINAVDVGLDPRTSLVLAHALLASASAAAVGSWFRWARVELAIRRNAPLPGPLLSPAVAGLIALVAAVLLVSLTGRS